MTIAFDATPLTAAPGGVARYTLELARALAAKFPQDAFWLLSDQQFPLPDTIPGNLHRGQIPRTPFAKKWWLWGLSQEMMRRGVDVFHGTDFAVPYLPFRPSVMTVHDLSPWIHREWQSGSSRVRRRTPMLLRAGLATMVITPSEAIRQAAIERFRLPADRVVAVPLAASTDFHPVDVPPVPIPYFLFVGTLEPRKNVTRLIEAWREARKSCVVDLVLAGRSRSDFAAPSSEPGLRVLGEVPENDLPKLYSGAAAVVYPSLYEGFGLPVLEAMQCGALAITSRDPAIREVSGDAAVDVDARDTRALAEAMVAIVSTPEKFADLRKRAVARAREFSWERTAERTREVYDTARRVFRQ